MINLGKLFFWRRKPFALPSAEASVLQSELPPIKFPSFFVVPPAIQDWATRMEMAHGPTCGVWRRRVNWLTALAIVRYGEAPDKWPSELSEGDAIRAARWLDGTDIPYAVTWHNSHVGGPL